MSQPPASLESPVLILGGGINGAAAAREFALNGRSVVLVEQSDLAFGATARSSRLIHGGLRYLEHGEFSLVKESLAERTRLLQLAPDFVRPLRLFIPVKNRWGGLWQSAARFLGMSRGKSPPQPRGLALVRMGLWLYDTYARDHSLPRRSLHDVGEPGTPPVTPAAGKWLAAYSDAQICFPERIVVALLSDAQKAAEENLCTLQVFTRHEAHLQRDVVEIRPTQPGSEPVTVIKPAAIINATGAWVDEALRRLTVKSGRLMGGTKGSHFFTWNARLKEMLGGNGIYTEAADARPVFLLPLAEGTLVGTTDLPFEGDPASAVATPEELDYLLGVVRGVFPDACLSEGDIAWHYSGVRPLPYADKTTPAAITRRHHLVWNKNSPIPLISLVGGKLTTCRSLAEETATAVLERLGVSRQEIRNTQARVIPGGVLERERETERRREGETERDSARLAGTSIPLRMIREVIRGEWAQTLDDLIERRLMLLYGAGLCRRTLTELATILVEERVLDAARKDESIAACEERLDCCYGLRLS